MMSLLSCADISIPLLFVRPILRPRRRGRSGVAMRRSRISQTFRRRIDYRVGALAIGPISTNKPLPLQTQVSVHGRQPDDGGQPLGFRSSSVPAQADSMTYSFVIANQVTEPHRRCSIVSALTGRRL